MINNNAGYHVAGFIVSKIFEKYICYIKNEKKKVEARLSDSWVIYIIIDYEIKFLEKFEF